jgi:uncharacterized protein involved in exopolysaccharide biosynthesis
VTRYLPNVTFEGIKRMPVSEQSPQARMQQLEQQIAQAKSRNEDVSKLEEELNQLKQDAPQKGQREKETSRR